MIIEDTNKKLPYAGRKNLIKNPIVSFKNNKTTHIGNVAVQNAAIEIPVYNLPKMRSPEAIDGVCRPET
jgi:hypothetical protein